MMTFEEEYKEFWMLTKGILQDGKVDTEEAKVVRCWLREHNHDGMFDWHISRLDKKLQDNWVDRFESPEIVEAIGDVSKKLRAKI